MALCATSAPERAQHASGVNERHQACECREARGHYQTKRQRKSPKYDDVGIGLYGKGAIVSIEGNRD